METEAQILDNNPHRIELHFSVEVTKEMVNFVKKFPGVEWVPFNKRYNIHIQIGAMFDPESVVLNLQAELIKEFG